MSLTDLWKSSQVIISSKSVQQILGFAGDGKLIDGSETSQEFREFLSIIPSEMLDKYCTECLTSPFDQGGYTLQDLVNEIGRRLDFTVTPGLYRGRKGSIGNDGIWHSVVDQHDIVIEVKTTDAYRISVVTLAKYRNDLAAQGEVSDKPNSSILIVVGRQDTGELEDQIRGSGHADEIRIVSVEALIRLLKVKVSVESVGIHRKICAVLKPQEFTKVDGIIDLVFSTREAMAETKSEIDLALSNTEDVAETKRNTVEESITDNEQPVSKPASFNEQCILRISEYLGRPLTKQSRTTYRSPDGQLVVSCAVSKDYGRGRHACWFAFHPTQRERLSEAADAYAAFGCGSEDIVFLIPFREFETWLGDFNQTLNEDRQYWHVRIIGSDSSWQVIRAGHQSGIDITKYLL